MTSIYMTYMVIKFVISTALISKNLNFIFMF